MQVTQIESIKELRSVAAQWDDLWSRAEVTRPTLRAELVAQWLEHFAPHSRFRAVIVEEGGRFVAALPLVGTKLGPLLEAGGLPNNEWSPSGDLLLDPDADVAIALDRLVGHLNRLSWKLLWLEGAEIAAPRWQALLAALDRAELAADYREMFRVGVVTLDENWEKFQARQSRNLRRNMKRHTRDLENKGELQFRFETPSPEQAAALLQRGFQVEDRSWKNAEGTSVLQTDGMAEFYSRQAEALAETAELAIAILEHNGRPISFEYSWLAKETYHSFKVGYDAEFGSASPGQLLLYRLLERFHNDGHVRKIDFLGPLTEATRRFATDTYSEGRLVIAPRRLLSRALLSSYKHIWPQVKRLRRRDCERSGEQAGYERKAAVTMKSESPAAD